ncbi:TonB-dependent receptor [Wenzhouxiangella sp. AB-CW3]|uniref:TonB-dependent receptor plug domain-containing protein n=1 Tax=Wenzhouxiangella sp. AB-CW3 TaxID=2771012 RepID=UPI00168AFF02|nr:TonB-dependent receptor [Wenzhouxiangella sp. AB-CW3]QOC21472.1 TonB-dependent receptor [Wenzhouxiangella sp. AB-CW3]
MQRLTFVLAVCGTFFLPAGPAVAETSVPGAADADRVVSVASAREQDVIDAPASVTVISRDELIILPVRDILDAVRDSAGVTLTSEGFTRRGIALRGQRSSDTLFLLDGRRVSASSDVVAHSDFELDWIPFEAIERIEVVRGPLSSLYGSEALGGVINVVTRAETREWSGSARLRTGTLTDASGGRERQAGFYAGGGLGETMALQLFADHNTQQSVPDRTDEAVSLLEGRTMTSAGFIARWEDPAGGRLRLGLKGSNEERERFTRQSGPPPNTPFRRDENIDRRLYDLSYSRDFNGLSVQGGVYRADLSRTVDGSISLDPSPIDLTDDIADLRVFFKPRERHDVLLGGEVRRERIADESLVETGRESADRAALLVQDQIQLAEAVRLTLGLRMDHHDVFGSHLTPRAYLNWQVSDRLRLRGGYGEGFRAPTLKQLSGQFEAFGGGGRFLITGNPDLEPETSRNMEVGLVWHSDLLRLETVFFRNTASDLIQTACVSACGQFGEEVRDYRNIARTRVTGLENALSLPFGVGWEARLSHTWLDAEIRDTNQDLPERPSHIISGSLQWQGQDWHVLMRASHVGSQSRQVGPAFQDLPSYTLWHLGVGRDLSDRLTLRAGLENLADTDLADKSEFFHYSERPRYLFLALDGRF